MNESHPDIFSLYSSEFVKNSLKRPVELDQDLPSLGIPAHFEKYELPDLGNNYFGQMRDFISPFAEQCEQKSFGGNVFTALYEGLLNAYTHGNKKDNSKNVLFGSNIKENNIEFIIADEGEKLHPDFMRFILAHRERTNQQSNFINWYKFSDAKKDNEYNNGTGTSFMHAYMDNVLYYKSKDLGGLAVYLSKAK
ncbi:MAG: ATP-binding protein [Nanoarchaeota archaeon]